MWSLNWNCPSHKDALGFPSSFLKNTAHHKASWEKMFSALHKLWQWSFKVQTLPCSPAWIYEQRSAQSLSLGLALPHDLPSGLLSPYAPSSFPLRAGGTQETATCSSEPAKSESSKGVGSFWQRKAMPKQPPTSPCQKIILVLLALLCADLFLQQGEFSMCLLTISRMSLASYVTAFLLECIPLKSVFLSPAPTSLGGSYCVQLFFHFAFLLD